MAHEQQHDDIQPERILLRHLSGSKAGRVESFSLDATEPFTFGRAAASTVQFDPDRDDLVSRQHAKIEQDADDPTRFTITDLDSRNGTFVNKQRIPGLARLMPGDVIQLGPGGPEVEFDLDPRPDNLLRKTRLADDADGAPRPTREHAARQTAAPDRASTASAGDKRRVGKATVERMVAQVRGESHRMMLGGGVGLFLLMAVIAWAVWPSTPAVPEGPMTPTEIAAANVDKVVFIEFGWTLFHTQSGRQIYHEYVPRQDSDGNTVYLAAYVKTEGSIVPRLTLSEGDDGQNRPIAVAGATGSGFVVGSDGFILTNRHVAAAWHHVYRFPEDAAPGVVYDQVENTLQEVGTTEEAPADWIPAQAIPKHPLFAGKLVEGRMAYLDVTFAKNEQRWPAELVSVNPGHDVAMIKVNIPESLPTVTLHDNYDTIQSGDAITIMGYPGISPKEVVGITAHNFDNRGQAYATIPDPTTTPGTIGRVIRGTQAPAGRSTFQYFSTMGDYYQLTASETGAGNSGGPVFDDQGRVIGLFTASNSRLDGTRITFAVPIRHGLKLMGRQQVVQ